MSCIAFAALYAHCETLFIAKMALYFPQQPPELHSTQSPIITDVKGECKVQMRDSSYLVWLWPHNRNFVGRRAYMCNTWQKTQL